VYEHAEGLVTLHEKEEWVGSKVTGRGQQGPLRMLDRLSIRKVCWGWETERSAILRVYELACPNRENNEPVERYRFDTEGRKKGELEPDIY
jgi:hypothetical protein